MSSIVIALFGWLIPGGAYLLTRRYLQFAGFLTLVTVTFLVSALCCKVDIDGHNPPNWKGWIS